MTTPDSNNSIPRRVDNQGRIFIGKEHRVTTFSVKELDNGDILLQPVVAVYKEEIASANEAVNGLLGLKDIDQPPVSTGEMYDEWLHEKKA
jgi:hypothetical protein